MSVEAVIAIQRVVAIAAFKIVVPTSAIEVVVTGVALDEVLAAAASNGSTKIGGAPSADLDTLKKRAERFGTNTSTSLKKMEVDEAIKRRQERFGVVDKNEPKVLRIK